MPVVKADGYGHGAVHVARRLVREGAPILAVAVVEEGLELRRGGITAPILVMGWIGRDQLCSLVDGNLTPNIHSPEQAEELKSFLEGEEGKAAVRSAPLPVHLKLDTGMTRLGVRPEALPRVLDLLDGMRGRIFLEGVFQNFASSDRSDDPQTEAQTHTFEEILSLVRSRGHRPSMIHTDNSAAMLVRLGNSPSKKSSLFEISHVRPGLALYTRVPGLPSEANACLSDVMSFVSVVDQVKAVPPGTRVGYGGTFVCARETRIAIVPAGYADGIPRHLSGRGQVLVGGRRCPIAGRVSMDMTAVDVTDLVAPPSRGGDVVFFGTQGGARLGAEEVATAADTVVWEVLCGVGPRVPRIILEGGRVIAQESKFL